MIHPTQRPVGRKESKCISTATIGRHLAGRNRTMLMTLAVALCAAMALSVSLTTPPASAATTISTSAYNDHNQSGWMCPVATTAIGKFKRSYDEDGDYTLTFKVTTATTTGYNGYIFAACRAYVYVDIVNKNGDVMETLAYEPWAGPLSTNFEKWDAEPDFTDEAIAKIGSLRIQQYPRY